MHINATSDMTIIWRSILYEFVHKVLVKGYRQKNGSISHLWEELTELGLGGYKLQTFMSFKF